MGVVVVAVAVFMWQMLHDHLKIKFSVLRAYYERLDRDAGNLVAALHAKYDRYYLLLTCKYVSMPSVF